jgi:hypothetical protein
MREWRLHQYYSFLDTIKHELNLTKTDIQRIRHIINKVGVKKLHKNATSEQIILALAVFSKEESTKKTIDLKSYKILREHKINYKIYTTVLRNLLIHYRQRMPITW